MSFRRLKNPSADYSDYTDSFQTGSLFSGQEGDPVPASAVSPSSTDLEFTNFILSISDAAGTGSRSQPEN